MILTGRNRRAALTASQHLPRWILAFAAIAALSACGEGDAPDVGGSGTSSSSSAIQPTVTGKPRQRRRGSVGHPDLDGEQCPDLYRFRRKGGHSSDCWKFLHGPLTSSQTYTLTCSGAGGQVTQSQLVKLSGPAAALTVRLSASPSTISSMGSSVLTWSSTNATQCGRAAAVGVERWRPADSGRPVPCRIRGFGQAIDHRYGRHAHSGGHDPGEPELGELG
jgi:hypothetical protein